MEKDARAIRQQIEQLAGEIQDCLNALETILNDAKQASRDAGQAFRADEIDAREYDDLYDTVAAIEAQQDAAIREIERLTA